MNREAAVNAEDVPTAQSAAPKNRQHRKKFYIYAGISVAGLLISAGVFFILRASMGMSAYYANWVGDIVALVFVFVCSWVVIFEHSRQQMTVKFLLNLVAKLLVIYLISVALAYVSRYLDKSSLFEAFSVTQRNAVLTAVKILMAPASLFANYVLTFIIIEKFNKG